jgi:hypothetical protein
VISVDIKVIAVDIIMISNSLTNDISLCHDDISNDIKVIAMEKKQVLIRLDDAVFDWLESQCSELGISKPQLVVSILKEKMLTNQPISIDINDDITIDGSVSSAEFEKKCNDINEDINKVDTAISVINSLVSDNRLAIEDIGTDINDINSRLAVIEQWIASRPKPGRPKKST